MYSKFVSAEKMKTKLGIVDSTLREGEQTPGVEFSGQVRRNIISHLHRIGIEEIELGVSSPPNTYIPRLVHDAKDITKRACRTALWCRCLAKDIAFAGACAPDVLSLSIPTSDIHICNRLKKDRNWILKTVARSITTAIKAGIPSVSLGLEDSSRSDPTFLIQLAKTASENGAQRIRLADTLGICTPASISKLVSQLRQQVNIEIGVHCHNDFGMATGNSMAALEAGATWVDATVLGLGERTGNCRLEEICGSLVLLTKEKKYTIEKIPELCEYVASVSKKPIPDNHPLAGKAIFTCESGLHQHGLAVNTNTYEPYDPKKIGKKRTLLFGKKSGKRALLLQLQKVGIHLDRYQLKQLTHKVRNNGQPLTEQQLTEFTIKHLLR